MWNSRTKIVGCALGVATLALAARTAVALTGGPAQPEPAGFSPVGGGELVDPFTGDLGYTIDLGDIGGYPLALSYSSNVRMDDEASWVGLGWNLSPGSITRSKRGYPDEFAGVEKILEERSIAPNWTVGADLSTKIELFGAKVGDGGLTVGVGGYYNNYDGYGLKANAALSLSGMAGGHLSSGVGLNADSNAGVALTPTLGLSATVEDTEAQHTGGWTNSVQLGVPINSRAGLSGLTMTLSQSYADYDDKVGSNNKVDRTYYASGSASMGSSLSFAGPGLPSRPSFPMFASNATLSVSGGLEGMGVFGAGEISGYYAAQWLKFTSREVPAYGYLFLAKAPRGQDALLDFSRENDGGYTKTTPNLSMAFLNYDLFMISGQGVGGQFRAHQGSVGIVFDPPITTTTTGASGGLDLGPGAFAKGGIDVEGTYATTASRLWTGATNKLAELLAFVPTTAADATDPAATNLAYEGTWFQLVGETTPDDDPDWLADVLGGESPEAPTLGGMGAAPVAQASLTGAGLPRGFSDGNQRTTRHPRNTHIAAITADVASKVGMLPTIPVYPRNAFALGKSGYQRLGELPRTSSNSAYGRFNHHPSEFDVTTPDGRRYIYGFPVLNYTEVEATFAVDPSASKPMDTGLVTYEDGVDDNVLKNKLGRDHFVDRVTTPAYAYAWNLTAVVSPDYVDVNGDGPGPGDRGTWVRFNYTMHRGEQIGVAYRWRVPVSPGSACAANHNEGFKSDPDDDKGTYLYGTKQIAYLHSIETATHVAEFTLFDRHDAHGVSGPCGQRDDAQTQLGLERIDVFSRRDRELHGDAAIPIKTVHFAYDYSLAADPTDRLPNGEEIGEGKLTLRKVWFTYANDPSGERAAYAFDYADADHDGVPEPSRNPSYDMKAYDRWGGFVPVAPDPSWTEPSATPPGKEGPPWEDPYVDPYLADDVAEDRAAAWLLSTVRLPSGGRIRVDYEPDDYAYVQDEPVAFMAPIVGAAPTGQVPPNALAEARVMHDSGLVNPYLYFELVEPIPAAGVSVDDASKLVRAAYMPSKPLAPFRFLMRIDDDDSWEYVPGWATIVDITAAPAVGGAYTHGVVRLKNTTVGDQDYSDEASPIARTAWQFTRLYRPQLAYGKNGESDGKLSKELLEEIYEVGSQLASFFGGFNRHLRKNDQGMVFAPGRSWIRLRHPTGFRRGGGVRVRQVQVTDAWPDMSSSSVAQRAYTTTYDYTMEEAGRVISSGVAASEPMNGADESALQYPVYFDEETGFIPWAFGEDKLFAPDDSLYQVGPYGAGQLPSPSVGYARVTARQVYVPDGTLDPVAVTRRGTGAVVHEFFTARDFPTETRATSVNLKKSEPKLANFILPMDLPYLYTASQGWAVVRQNAHGTPKATWVQAEGQVGYISGTEYHYLESTSKVELPGVPSDQWPELTRLGAQVPVLGRDGDKRADADLGTTVDLVVDMREELSEAYTGGAHVNLDTIAALFPIPIPMIIPTFQSQTVDVRIATATKVVDRFPVLREVVAHDAGAAVSTENLAWDAVTGEVIAHRTPNAHGDPVYSLTWPAHYAYAGMAPAYENQGQGVSHLNLVNGANNALYPGVVALFQPGDELAVVDTKTWSTRRGWVLEASGTTLRVIDEVGDPLSGGDLTVVIVRSGHRNQQSLPIGDVAMLTSPLDGSEGITFPPEPGVFAASALEYSEVWGAACFPDEPPGGCAGQIGFDLAVPADHATIQGAIDAASEGDRICVDGGVYVEDLDFKGKAIEVIGVEGASGTVVRGTGNGPVVSFVQGETSGALLQGFTITGGDAKTEYGGGGVFVSSASPTLRQLDVSGNASWTNGGGLSLVDSASLVDQVTVSCNTARGDGGGAFTLRSSPAMSSVVFHDNATSGDGGGLAAAGLGVVWLDDAVFVHNAAEDDGGGISSKDNELRLANALFLGNTATDVGGGAAAEALVESGVTLTNVTFVENKGIDGAALYVFTPEPAPMEGVVLDNAIVAYNKVTGTSLPAAAISRDAAGGLRVRFTDTWDNVAHYGWTPDPIGLDGNIAKDPLFLAYTKGGDPNLWDLALDELSPAVNGGLTTLLDQDGTRSDMGGYGGPSSELWYFAADDHVCATGEAGLPTSKSVCAVSGGQVNPFRVGLLGDWRAWRPWVYDVDRVYADRDAGYVAGDAWDDGRFATFSPFWVDIGDRVGPTYAPRWRAASTVTQLSPSGQPREEVDALGRYGAVQFDVEELLPLAVGGNTRYRQLGFTSFEDLELLGEDAIGACAGPHFDWDEWPAAASSVVAHTGWWSLTVDPGGALPMSWDLTTDDIVCDSANDDPVMVDACGCGSQFSPDADETYVLGYWVYQDLPPWVEYPAGIEVAVGGIVPDLEIVRSDPIEGWQRVEVTFAIPAGTTGTIDLIATNPGDGQAWFDDVRIAPYDARLKTYVYDVYRRWLMAELDENNYASLYEYARDGSLVRVKKETERGVMTVQETRSHVAGTR